MLDASELYRLELRLACYVGSKSGSKPQLSREEHEVLHPPKPERRPSSESGKE